MKLALKKRAYEEAAALLETEMDRIDMPEDLNAIEESEMREFIRVNIVAGLRAKGQLLR